MSVNPLNIAKMLLHWNLLTFQLFAKILSVDLWNPFVNSVISETYSDNVLIFEIESTFS